MIDTTGDGDVAARAGLPFIKGRENDGAMRPTTVMGRIGNVDLRRLKEYSDARPEDFSRDDGSRVVDLAQGMVRIDGFFSIVEKAKRTGLMDAASPVHYLRFSGMNAKAHIDRAMLICDGTRGMVSTAPKPPNSPCSDRRPQATPRYRPDLPRVVTRIRTQPPDRYLRLSGHTRNPTRQRSLHVEL